MPNKIKTKKLFDLPFERYTEGDKTIVRFTEKPLTFLREVSGGISKVPAETVIETRAAGDAPNSKKTDRVFRAVWTTGARVYRMGHDGPYGMELSLNEKHVRLERLRLGAPVLDNHDQANICGVASGLHGRSKGQIGVVENPQMTATQGLADLRLSRRGDVDDIALDMADGIIRNISVGFAIHKFEEVGEDEDGIPILRAVDWEPMEISPVKINADAPAQTMRNLVDMVCEKGIMSEDEKEKLRSIFSTENKRSVQTEKENKDIANSNELRQTESMGENTMTPEEKLKLENEQRAADEKRNQELTDAKIAAKADEKKRQSEIRSIVSKVGLEVRLAEKYIDEDKSVDEVRTLVIDALADKDKAPSNDTRSMNTSIEVGEDLGRRSRVEGMTSALLHRFRPNTVEERNANGQKITMRGHELTEPGKQFAYLSLVEMARHCLEAQGVRTGMFARHQIADIALNNVRAGGLHSISDFPEILANVANKTLRDGYQAAPQTFMPFTSLNFVSDFKEISRTNLGDAPALEKVPEGGEVSRGSMSENAEKYRIEEYAKIIALSRKTIINDDLGAFTKVPERMGRRAKDLESDVVYDVIKLNANMADGNALFSVAHTNLSAAPGAPAEAAFTEMRTAMRRQKGLDGAELSLVPNFLIVTPGNETAAEKALSAINPNQTSQVNPYGPQGRTTLGFDVEPRLESGTGGSLTHWFGFADKSQIDMVELSMLEGSNGPQFQSRDGFEVAGMEIKIMHDVAAKALDWKGVWKNAGA